MKQARLCTEAKEQLKTQIAKSEKNEKLLLFSFHYILNKKIDRSFVATPISLLHTFC
jgi:hypothetical protein